MGYDFADVTNTFTYDMWVKPKKAIQMSGESNVCSGTASVPLAFTEQNWVLVPAGINAPNMSVGLSVGTNGIMVGEHSANILLSRLSYTTTITDWVHIAVVYSSSAIYLYLNGNLVRSFDNSKFERTLGDIGFEEMELHPTYPLSPDNHIRTSEWNLDLYSGTDIDNPIIVNSMDFNYLWSTGETKQSIIFSTIDEKDTLSVEVTMNDYTLTDTIEIIGIECCFKTIYDTVVVHDTIYTEVFDTTYIAVTDTLVIDVVLSDINPVENIATLKVYPNPAKEYLYIQIDDYIKMNGYTLKVLNELGSVVYETNISDPLYEINLSTWTGKGTYIMQIIAPNSAIKAVKKIILQ